MTTFRTAPAILLGLLAACASPSLIEGYKHPLELELRDLQTTQRVFREQNTVPQVFNFEGHGRVTVREITLDGFPGEAYLRCRFHYENRTKKPVVQSFVMLDVINARGQTVSTQGTVCIVPHIMPIGRGEFVMDELRTPTKGVHLEDGWGWRIRCVAELQQPVEPLDPPADMGGWPVFDPIIIKNRGQNDYVFDDYYDQYRWPAPYRGPGYGRYLRDGQGYRVPGGGDRNYR